MILDRRLRRFVCFLLESFGIELSNFQFNSALVLLNHRSSTRDLAIKKNQPKPQLSILTLHVSNKCIELKTNRNKVTKLEEFKRFSCCSYTKNYRRKKLQKTNWVRWDRNVPAANIWNLSIWSGRKEGFRRHEFKCISLIIISWDDLKFSWKMLREKHLFSRFNFSSKRRVIQINDFTIFIIENATV